MYQNNQQKSSNPKQSHAILFLNMIITIMLLKVILERFYVQFDNSLIWMQSYMEENAIAELICSRKYS